MIKSQLKSILHFTTRKTIFEYYYYLIRFVINQIDGKYSCPKFTDASFANTKIEPSTYAITTATSESASTSMFEA